MIIITVIEIYKVQMVLEKRTDQNENFPLTYKSGLILKGFN